MNDAPKTDLIQQGIGGNNPQSMLARLVEQNAPMETLQKFMDLSERWQANQARMAFNAAFASFKAETVRIIKNTSVTDGPLKGKKYADLFDIVNGVTELLAKHGLAHSWKLTKDEKDWMEVTCILRHADGHCETDTQGGAPDTGPGRNAIQARRSTRTYLEKSTLTGVTGLASANSDDDGAGGPKTVALITDEQAIKLDELIDSARNGKDAAAYKVKFLKFLKVAKLEELPAQAYEHAEAELKRKITANEKVAKA